MSISNLVKANAPKAYGLPSDHLHQANPKALGGTGQENSTELANWYEQAYSYYQNVQNGTEPMPDQAAWTEFMNQMNWAYQQLWGNGTGASGWGDPVGGQGLPGNEESFSDPFGGKVGPNGDIIYDSQDAKVGFLGDGKTRHFFSHNIDINVASTSAKVSVVEIMDDSLEPPEKVWKVIVDNPIMGEKDVYIIHDPEDLQSLNIMTPDQDQVDIQVQSDAVQWKEFVEGGMADGSGMPEGADVEDGVATHDGVMGQFLDFQPPFGNIDHHIVYGDLNISVKASDEVVVEKLATGGYEITVIDRDGKRTTFELKDGFKLNINAHPNNVTFKNGAKGPSATGDLKLNGGEDVPDPNTNGPWNGVDGVPESFEGVSLNGVEGPTGEPEDPNPDHESWPPEFKDLLEEMGIDWKTTPVELPDDVKELIEDGLFIPGSGAMRNLLDALLGNDSGLKNAWEAAKGSDKVGDWNTLRDRLLDLLNTAFGDKLDYFDASDLPEGVELDDLEIAHMFKHDNGTVYKIEVKNGKIRIEEVDMDELQPAEPESETDQASLAIAEDLANRPLVDLTAQEILDKAEEMGVNLAHTQLSFPPSNDLIHLLYEIDPNFKSKLDSMTNVSVPSEGMIIEVRDELIEMLSLVYKGSDYTFTPHDRDNLGAGVDDRENDLWVHKDGQIISRWNIFSDDMDNNGYVGDPWSIFTWESIT